MAEAEAEETRRQAAEAEAEEARKKAEKAAEPILMPVQVLQPTRVPAMKF